MNSENRLKKNGHGLHFWNWIKRKYAVTVKIKVTQHNIKFLQVNN